MNEDNILNLKMVSVPQLPYWEHIAKDMTRKGYHPKTFEQTVNQVLSRIERQVVVCSDCGNETPFRMPLTTKELADFVVLFINTSVGFSCEDCLQKAKHEGRILAECRTDEQQNKEMM